MDLLAISLDVSFVLVMLGVAFAFVRLLKGPSLPDRIVALDMMTVLIVSFCGLYAILSEDTAFVDVAIVLALVGFLATVALARFVERRVAQTGGQRRRPEDDRPPIPSEERRMMAEIIMAALVLLGGFFCFVAGLGVLRLPDVLIRMHASTKAGTLGSGLILARWPSISRIPRRSTRAVLRRSLFLLITAPVAAHMIGRAAFRSGVACGTPRSRMRHVSKSWAADSLRSGESRAGRSGPERAGRQAPRAPCPGIQRDAAVLVEGPLHLRMAMGDPCAIGAGDGLELGVAPEKHAGRLRVHRMGGVGTRMHRPEIARPPAERQRRHPVHAEPSGIASSSRRAASRKSSACPVDCMSRGRCGSSRSVAAPPSRSQRGPRVTGSARKSSIMRS
jgi:multicomponent Na+:H+ antiporter subunit F